MANHFPNYKFKVTINSDEVFCQKVLNLSVGNQILSSRSGNDLDLSEDRSIGLQTFKNVILVRPLTKNDNTFFDFWKSRPDLSDTEQSHVLAIELLDNEGKTTVKWTLTNALAIQLSYSELDARGSDLVTESLEISFDGFDIEIMG